VPRPQERDHHQWRTLLRNGLFLLGLSGLLLSACSSSSAPPTSTTTTTAALSGFAGQPAATILSDACGATLDTTSLVASTVYATPLKAAGVISMRWTTTKSGNSGAVLYLGKGALRSVVTPLTTYLRGNVAYWTTNAAPPQPTKATSLAGKWVSIATTSPNSGIAAPSLSQSSLQGLLANCVPPVPPVKGSVSRGGTTPTISVSVSSAGQVQTFFVATSGPPYIVKTTITGAPTGNQVTLLSGFNSQPAIGAPAGSTPIDPLLAAG
jgi:hypothetical protein